MNFEIGAVMDAAGDTYTVVETPSATNSGRIRFKVDMVPTPTDLIMPLHSHPAMTETTEMIVGVMEIYTGGRHLRVGPGESYSSAPGVAHKGRNPGPDKSQFYWTLTPEASLQGALTQTVGGYFAGCAVCGILGHFALMRLEQYLHEGITGKDVVTGEPIHAGTALAEVGSMIDKAGGLRAVVDSADVFLLAKPFMAGILTEPVRTKLYELITALAEQGKAFDSK
ncbi:hypothetical protein SEUCBS139899_009861 [Sporothrix eucalyptigena]|uniref:Cupin type-2 domain-containing protein n=1 Tax=Sporothrix eucalyptigena TaxID=1812306 RepID=A0ABP0CYE5_9PEZI